MSSDAIQLVTTKPDSEVAEDIKMKIEAAMKPVLAVFDEAVRAGFLVQWDGLAPDAFGRHRLVGLRLVKHF